MSGPVTAGRPELRSAALVLAVGCLLTALTSVWLQHLLEVEARAEFARGAQRIADLVVRRLEQPVYGLNGARGVLMAAPALRRDGFRRYVASRDLPGEFPGVRGFGLIRPVRGDRLAEYVRQERADGSPQFEVRQLQPGDHALHFVITYIEPLQPNEAAVGLDVGSEPRRRAAAEQAVDSGLPTMTSPIALVQDTHQRPAVLLFSPVWMPGEEPQTPQARQARLRGLAYAPIVIGELLEDVRKGLENGGLHFELEDTAFGAAPATLIFDAARPLAPLQSQAAGTRAALSSRFQTVHRLHVNGREIALHVHSLPSFESATLREAEPIVAAVAGVLFSLLLAVLVAQQASGRRRAEAQAERATEEVERLAQVARHTSNAVAIAGADRCITWVNEGYTRVTGLSLQEVVGRPLAELLRHAGTADERSVQAWCEALRRGTGCRVELLKHNREGRAYWADTELQPLRDAQRRLVGFMEIASDVTDRRQAQARLQAALHDNDQLLRTLDAYALVAITDPMGAIRSINEAFCQASGFAREELLGGDRRVLDSGHHPKSFWIEMTRQVRGGSVWRGEILYRFKDGSLHWYESTVAPFRGPDGQVSSFITIGHEITALKDAEQQVRRAEALMRGAIDTVNEGFVIYDPQDRLVMCNDKYREIYADSADVIQPGNTFETIIRTGAERGQYAAALGRVDEWVAERMAVHLASNITLVQQLGDGRWLRILERKTPEGYIVGFRIDITDLMHAREAAEAASRSKGQFLANMSHEIRTPMNAILGMLQLLRRTPLAPRQRDYADKTERAARAMLALLNDILDFSKLDAEKMQLDPRPFELDALLRDLSVILAANLGGKPVEVVFDIDPALPRGVVGDDLRLQQVLVNLSGNAIKFTESGEVVIGLHSRGTEGDQVRLAISVRDSGIGIAPEHQEQIFSGFSQAEASTTRRFGGTGLGLAISQRLVGMMGGRLHLESRLGEGSCFSFELLLPVASAASLPPPGAAPVEGLGPLRVLLIDDHPSALYAEQRMAQALGWHVVCGADRSQALRQAQDARAAGRGFDAVLVDGGWADELGADALQGLVDAATPADPDAPGGYGPRPLLIRLATQRVPPVREPEGEDTVHFDAQVAKPVTASLLRDAWLEAQSRDDAPPVSSGQAPAGARLTGVRLLLVEDNLINQQVACELLEAEGAQVQLAGDGQQALAVLRRKAQRVDLVLMDLQMPVMDGLSATRAIRQEPGLQSLPIVAMTANALPADREAALDAGMNDHVGKPFDLEMLVQVLLAQLGRAGTAARDEADGSEPPQAEPDLEELLRRLEAPARLPTELAAAAAAADVHIGTALGRMHGRIDIYHRMLHRLTHSLAATSDELVLQGERGDAETVTRSLHTLKGSLAMLGADALATVLAELERQASDQARLSMAARQAHARLSSELPRLQALLAAVALADRPDPQAAQTRKQALRAKLDRLDEMLQTDDPVAPQLMGELRREHGRDLGASLMPLDDAVSTADRTRARALCQSLREQWAAAVD